VIGPEFLPATAVGLVGGAFVGMTGVGAGSVIAAFLLVFYPKVATHVIVGSATIQAIAMKLVGVMARRQFQLRERGLAIAMAVGAIPLAVAGAWVSSVISTHMLRPIVSFVLLVVGANLAVQSAHMRWKFGASEPSTTDPPRGVVALLGAGVGFIAGLTSVGTGTLFVSALVGPLRIPAHRAVAVALYAGLLTLVVSGATHLMLGHVSGSLVVATCLGSIPGVIFGTAFSQRLRATALRGVIGAGIMVAALIAFTRMGR
jgi:uncharacterized membrane protein YfcA